MQIDENILITWGGMSRHFKKNEIIFEEGQHPRCYFQIVSGSVKMFNLNKDSKEFIQGIFSVGESFGEPPLFTEEIYPASAVAAQDSIIIKIPKETFFKLLLEYPAIQQAFIHLFARRIYNKAATLRELVNNSPEDRILGFLDYCRKKYGQGKSNIEISFTRQEIANFTGLRVETVIRTLASMKERKLIDIRNRKLFY